MTAKGTAVKPKRAVKPLGLGLELPIAAAASFESMFSRDLSKYEEAIKQRALEAFRDDLGEGDITSDYVLLDSPARAVILAEEDCTVAGVLEATTILTAGGLTVSGKEDGSEAKSGDEIMLIEGSVRQILARERVTLNYLSRMSGIASLSSKLSKKHGKRVLFLRKTDPGLLFSEKRAVSLGGCLPHRMNLSDGILIKDNHISQLAKSGDRIGAIKAAINRVHEHRPDPKLMFEVEVESAEEAEVAAFEFRKLHITGIIMLDNMQPAEVKNAVKAAKSAEPGVVIEASGGITEENIGAYLKAGADFVSTSIFMAAKPAKFKLEILP
jgi:nicotinate-nucleotide pyrophosphorylase (carboxylating)